MLWQDVTNGLFELIAGCLNILNIIKLYKDKEVKGVHIIPVLLFTVWGYWNLYYYPFLSQWFSFIGGIFMVLFNTVWISQMIWYSRSKNV